MKFIVLLAAMTAVLAPASALANDRTVTVTSFDKLRIEGNFIVDVVTGHGPSARVSGSEAAIERTSISVQGQTLIIRANHSAWGGMPDGDSTPATIRLTTQFVRAAAVTGSAAVRIDAMRAAAVTIALEGSGVLTVTGIETDALDVGIAGAGKIVLAGKAAGARTAVRGTATLAATGLVVRDAKIIGESAGDLTLTAVKTANVLATGSGNITIAGAPACTIANHGSGTVSCASPARR